MTDAHDIFEHAASLTRDGVPFILITVIATKGSTPRETGAKMIWCPSLATAGNSSAPSHEPDGDTRALIGTVGGGQFELLVIDAAEKHLRHRSSGVEQYVLGADADQCCGGVMDVFFEYHASAHRLVIFGAGHVAHELASLLAPAPLSIVIADDRPAWNSAERFPAARRVTTWDEGARIARELPDSTLACVMTCSHDTDFEILRLLLADGTPPSFVGLIGSRSKRVCLFGRLVASGIDEQRVLTVHCPIGVGDTGKAPRLVAISMAAQLLLEAKKRAPL